MSWSTAWSRRYRKGGEDHGYFATPADAELFEHELTWLLVHQYFSFNSPVWFNVGTSSPQQVSACFILSVDDSMDSILNWYKEEGFIFKGGSGAGLNLSRIRSSKELLSSGGTASGPVSFMRGADASAGTIKSGGATRRAAKMVVLDVNHPDIEEFVMTKAREEDKIRALRDAGFDMDLGGSDITSVQYQNANNSVRVSDEFMRAVEDGTEFGLRGRKTGEVIETVDARELFRKISTAAWECADPGLQYDDTINDWHTNPETGRITASNPCSEYMSLDNSSCNLASLNLLKFLRDDDTFDAERFAQAVELIITAMDISICFADFPTKAIGDTTRDYRQLGIGYANLGALLMAMGLGYDSDGGRAMAGALTSLMTGTSYRRSAELAAVVGPYAGYARNAEAHQRVMRKHQAANDTVRALAIEDDLVHKLATKEWAQVVELGKTNGFRNAQASVLAPTGTIGFMMDCDTTGIEPDFSLVKFKKLVGGGSMQIVNQTIPRALRKMGYQPRVGRGDRRLHRRARPRHRRPRPAPGALRGLRHRDGCPLPQADGPRPDDGGLPAVPLRRDLQDGQPPRDRHGRGDRGRLPPVVEARPQGHRDLPRQLQGRPAAVRWQVRVLQEGPGHGRGAPGRQRPGDRARAQGRRGLQAAAQASPEVPHLPHHVLHGRRRRGLHDLRRPRRRQLGEVFLKLGKQGSTLAGVMDAFSIAVSIGLQYGVPLETYVSKFTNLSFEPAGLTDDADVRMAKSIMDYIFRRLALDYLDFETRQGLGVFSADERQRYLETGSYEPLEEIGSRLRGHRRPRPPLGRPAAEPTRSSTPRSSRPRTPTAPSSARSPPSPPSRPTRAPSSSSRSPAPQSTHPSA